MNELDVKYDIFCAGTAQKVSINNLFDIMNKKYNKNFKPNYLEQRDGDIKESICDNSKIKEVIEFNEFSKFEKKLGEI
jgi:UDP-glucose 4-epimerase